MKTILNVIFRLDSGANMFVGNQLRYFFRLIRRRIGVALGAGMNHYFEGIGVMAVSHPKYPSKLILLYPAFYAPKDNVCTISNGALKKCAGFDRVIIDTARSVELHHRDGTHMSIPTEHRSSIDYISLHVHVPTTETRQRLNYRHMSLQPAAINHPQLRGSPLLSMILHLKYNHRSVASIQAMIDEGFIEGPGFPCKLAPLPGRCPICDAAGLTKLRRGPLVDTTELPPGTRFHLDFTFFNVVSCRGFTSALIIVEATTRKLWFFPTKHKAPPLDLCLFFFNHLQRQGVPVLQLRGDEDGAFIGNTEFCGTMYKSCGLVMESTGGYASTINGKAESPHRTTKKTIRSMLMGANLDDAFWCFTGQYGTLGYNQCKNRVTGKIPDKEWTGKSIPPHDMPIFGANVKIVRELKAQRALEARTVGDPRALPTNPISVQDTIEVMQLTNTSAPDSDGRFVGFSNNKAVALVLTEEDLDKPTSHRIRRVHHCIIDEWGLSTNPSRKPLPNEQLLRTLYDQRYQSPPPPLEWTYDGSVSALETRDSPFHPSALQEYEVTLPPRGQSIGLSIVTDEDFLIPILMRIDPAKAIYKEIPTCHNFCRSWIVHIQNEQPLTAQGALDILQSLQLVGSTRKIKITFAKIDNPERKNYQQYRAIFDSMTGLRHARMESQPTTAPSSLPTAPPTMIPSKIPSGTPSYRTIAPSTMMPQELPTDESVRLAALATLPYDLVCAHLATLPYTPVAGRTFWDCLNTKERIHWIQATDHQYSKNQEIEVCATPEPIEKVPEGTKIYRAVLAPKIKDKGNDIYQFVTRMCLNGTDQLKGLDFDHSWSPTISAYAIRLTIMYAAVYRLIMGKIDVVNCFQNTLIEEKKRIIMHAPPFYMDWFRRNYPEVKVDRSPSGKYVLELLRGLQGDRSIGREWYLLLKLLLENFGFKQCHNEPALYRYWNEESAHLMIINTSTDDLLCAYSHVEIYKALCDYLKKYFDITTEEGTTFKYLNLRIIQSQHGISFDQTDHILRTIVEKFFPALRCEMLKRVHTPFRTDNEFERDLCEMLPATPSQLVALVKKYGGTFPEILGQLMHVYVFTRSDLGYTCSRLSRYTQAPSAAAFAGLHRGLRYLATHPHRPIIYPRRTLDGYDTLRVDFDPPKHEVIELPNGLILLVDSDHARDMRTRRSCECSAILMNGVGVDWKMGQQTCVGLHSTDSEARGTFTGMKRAIVIQDIASFLGFPSEHIYPTPVYCDSQPCIDILNSNSVTTRVKHIAVPIQWIHQQIYLKKFVMCKIGTHLNLSDSGTKPNSSPVHFRQFDRLIGVHFYPPPDSEHYKLLQLDKFVRSPFDAVPTADPSASPTVQAADHE